MFGLCEGAYIDDVIVVSECWSVLLVHLRVLFRTLSEAGLTCKVSKCEFGKRRMLFLGHVVGDGRLCVPEARVIALRQHPRPKTRKQLRAFLGLVGYDRRFIAGLHRWASVLMPHTSVKDMRRLEWTDQMVAAFGELCNVLSDVVCLCVPSSLICSCWSVTPVGRASERFCRWIVRGRSCQWPSSHAS